MSEQIEQRRILATAISGPQSLALQSRKRVAVSAGVGNAAPRVVEAVPVRWRTSP